ncbi:hypothetical protein ACNF42_05305 [Cuniculiplasma sp. SKW3]|uniref:hypothetical protein n=1 Tax=Cuniculiplasma sp. SKW3 TaxID=3400170 RepID=UPI003FCFF091
MISTLKAIIVAVIVIGVAVPSAYFAYTYSSSSPIEATHYIPNNSTAVIHIVNNTSDYYVFVGQGYAGLILNYSFNSFSDRAQAISNSTATSGKSVSQSSSSVNITSYKIYYGNTIYKVVLNNVNLTSLGVKGFPNITMAGIDPNNKNITLFATPIGDSYVIIGNLNATIFSISTNHFGTYWKSYNGLVSKSSIYDSFYVNLSALIKNNSASSSLSFVPNSNISSIVKEIGSLNYFLIEGNLTNQITNITIQMSNSTLLHQLISAINYKYGDYVISSTNPNTHTAEFEFGFGLKDLKRLNITQSSTF